jgi:hypothetical protein
MFVRLRAYSCFCHQIHRKKNDFLGQSKRNKRTDYEGEEVEKRRREEEGAI